MSSLRGSSREELLVYGLGFGCFFQQSVLLPVLPRYAGETTASIAMIGLILGARFLGPAIVAGPIGAWVAHIGVRKALMLAGAGMACGSLLYVVSHTPVSLILAQVTNGILYLAAWISAQTYATRMPNRDLVLGLFATMTALGMAVAPILGGLALDIGGYEWSFTLYAGGAVLLILNAWALGNAPSGRPTTGPVRGARGRTRTLLDRPSYQATLLFSFVCLFAISLRGNVLPILLEERAFSASLIGLVLGAGSLGQAAIRPFTHVLLKRFNLTRMLVTAAIVGIAGITGMTLFPVVAILLVLAFAHGAGAGLHQSLGLVLVADATSDGERGYAIGFRATVSQGAIAMAPILAGAVAALSDVALSLHIVAACLSVTILWLYRVLQRADAARSAIESRAV